jgi:hypothetical protein
MYKTLLILFFPLFMKSQQTFIVLNKQQKHFMDSVHTVFMGYLSHNLVDYQPEILKDSIHWILPTKIITDTNFSLIYNAIIRKGYGDSISVEIVPDSLRNK